MGNAVNFINSNVSGTQEIEVFSDQTRNLMSMAEQMNLQGDDNQKLLGVESLRDQEFFSSPHGIMGA